jgi:hypothetical protein
MIMQCSCKHKFQDKLYGSGMRVHNECRKHKHAAGGGVGGLTGYRCTVCATKKDAGPKVEHYVPISDPD